MSKNIGNKQNEIARIENVFIFNAQYKLPARDQKILLYLISKINPQRQVRFDRQVIAVKDLEKALKGDGKKWGGLYNEMKAFQKRIIDAKIEFPTEIEIGGRKFSGLVNWFQSIVPVKDEYGNVGIEFLFSEPLKPFLIDLNEYAKINYEEVIPLKSGFSARMFQIFRAHRDKMKRYEKRSTLKYSVDELKTLLGVADKYADWRNFKRKVVEVIEMEINKHTSIKVAFEEKRQGRKVIGLIFNFSDKTNQSLELKIADEDVDISKLSYAQLRAFDLLVEYQIKEAIAVEMIGRVGGSEFRGFEDWYFEEVTHIFEGKTKQENQGAKAGTLVKWFLEMKIFEQGDHFSRIIEKLQIRKKKLQRENVTAWGNRLMAKEMTGREFADMVKRRR